MAGAILASIGSREFDTVYEPFAGSAAITLASAQIGLARKFVIADSLVPLAGLWQAILDGPEDVAEAYRTLWEGQLDDPAAAYLAIRERFNDSQEPACLLYLLARCVKNSPRFNSAGDFNQSPDHRRLGTRPDKMARQLIGASLLLRGKTTVEAADFASVIERATPRDLVYLDPPWEGTSNGTDKRYKEGLRRERLIEELVSLHDRGVPYVLSYDGRHGTKTYGDELPDSIGATRIELDAGRSSQATLNGQDVRTIESLYVADSLADVCLRQPDLFSAA